MPELNLPPLTRLDVSVDALGVVHVTFPGRRADGVAVRELYETLVSVLESPRQRLVLDFTDVDHLTSGMIGMLVTARKKAMQAGGQVHVVLPDPLLMQQFKLTNLHRMIPAFDGLDTALNTFR